MPTPVPAPQTRRIVARLLVPLGWGLLASLLAALASHFAPESYASSLVGFIFVGLAALAVRSTSAVPREFGLEFGGLFDLAPLSLPRMAKETGQALAIALFTALVVFPPFTIGYLFWFSPAHPFSLERALSFGTVGPLSALDLALAHLLVVALPEEVFFRGYLQSSLERALLERQTSAKVLSLIASNLLTSILFAVGHFMTDPRPSRLAVFFPSLLFGLLRQRTGGVGASIIFHALSNLYSAGLAAGFAAAS